MDTGPWQLEHIGSDINCSVHGFLASDGVPLNQRIRLFFLVRFTISSRGKVKRLLNLGDEFKRLGYSNSAIQVYGLAVREARQLKTLHLLKLLDKRLEALVNMVKTTN